MDFTLVLVTLLSIALAGVMTTLAWRLAREERRRSDARVAALSAEIHADDLPLRHVSALDTREQGDGGGTARKDVRPRANSMWVSAGASDGLEPRAPGVQARRRQQIWTSQGVTQPLARTTSAESVASSGELFAAVQPAQARPRVALVVAAGLIVGGSAAALISVLGGSHADSTRFGAAASSISRTSEASGTSGAAQALGPAALELVALTHERDADRLTVRGVVRNPASGADVKRLTAVVFLLDRDGGFVASGRASVDGAPLEPGADAAFAVTIPGAAGVGRYRVSFRTDERVLPHVDRRDRVVAQLK